MKVFLLLAVLLAVAQGTEVEKKKKKKAGGSWPTNSWKFQEDGSIRSSMKKSASGAAAGAPSNEWYPATNSQEYGIKAWANLKANGKNYLVAAQQPESGTALPGSDSNPASKYIMFEVDQQHSDMSLERSDDMTIIMKPVSPNGHSLEKKKKKKMDFVGAAILANYWMVGSAMVAYGAWTWPLWAVGAGEQSLEKTPVKHKTLNKLLHSLEDDVHALSLRDHASLEKAEVKAGCFVYGVWFWGGWYCGLYLAPSE